MNPTGGIELFDNSGFTRALLLEIGMNYLHLRSRIFLVQIGIVLKLLRVLFSDVA